jgi:hypothetical protein
MSLSQEKGITKTYLHLKIFSQNLFPISHLDKIKQQKSL